MKPTAQSLILDLLSTTRGVAFPVKALVGAAGLFAITENNVRVALARLLARGLLERNERGFYTVASGSEPVRNHVASWVRVEERMVRWRGGWIGVYTAALGRGRGVEARHRRRALDFLGFAELDPDLWIRPDNLAGGVEAVRKRSYELGLEPRAAVFAMAELDEETDKRARGLWNVAALEAGYREMRVALAASAARLPELPIEEAMAECFTLGGEALRMIAFDPLLPEPILAADERRAFVDDMRRYDHMGRGFWRRFMDAHDAPYLDSPLKLRVIDALGVRPTATGGTA